MLKFLLRFLFFCILSGTTVSQAQTDRIQSAVNAFKRQYYSEAEDYIVGNTGHVFIKSYKKWTPDNLKTLKKEDPQGITFLTQAVQHKRFDVLNQLMPDYYNEHGGADAFASDILRVEADKSILPKKPAN